MGLSLRRAELGLGDLSQPSAQQHRTLQSQLKVTRMQGTAGRSRAIFQLLNATGGKGTVQVWGSSLGKSPRWLPQRPPHYFGTHYKGLHYHEVRITIQKGAPGADSRCPNSETCCISPGMHIQVQEKPVCLPSKFTPSRRPAGATRS